MMILFNINIYQNSQQLIATGILWWHHNSYNSEKTLYNYILARTIITTTTTTPKLCAYVYYPRKATKNINAPVIINIIGGACIFPSKKWLYSFTSTKTNIPAINIPKPDTYKKQNEYHSTILMSWKWKWRTLILCSDDVFVVSFWIRRPIFTEHTKKANLIWTWKVDVEKDHTYTIKEIERNKCRLHLPCPIRHQNCTKKVSMSLWYRVNSLERTLAVIYANTFRTFVQRPHTINC